MAAAGCCGLLAGAPLAQTTATSGDSPTAAPTGSPTRRIELVPADAAMPTECRADAQPRSRRPSSAAAGTARSRGGPLDLEADRVAGQGTDTLRAQGGVRARQDGLTLEADRLDFQSASNLLRATGQVDLRRGEDRYTGPELEFNTETQRGYFLSPRFLLGRTGGRGQADRVDFLGEQQMAVRGARYTGCATPEGESPSWELRARHMTLDFAHNDGYAEGAVLRFQDLPILALPVLSFPVTEERKSGWLPPMFNLSSKSGFELGVPYYWNIAPQADATLTPTYSSRRGEGVDAEARYLWPLLGGSLRLVSLPHDAEADRGRWALAGKLASSSQGAWSLDLNLLRASDPAYWRDGLRGAESLTPRLLSSAAEVRRLTRYRWDLGSEFEGEIDQQVYAGVQRWQILQASDANATIAPPYQRAPRLGTRWSGQSGPLVLEFETEVNRFTNLDPSLAGGERAHAVGQLGWQFGDRAWSLTPRLAFNAASYRLGTADASGRRDLGRVVPSVSLDNRWVLERPANWMLPGLRQTLEPRLVYQRTPYRDQASLPNYDSAALDLNATTMFEGNSFSGVDRVADIHALTAGVTTRFVDGQSGAEYAQLGIAQRFLLAEQRVTPDGVPLTQRASDLFLLGATQAIDHWGMEGAVQVSTQQRRTIRNVTKVRYTPEPFHALSLTYRYQRDLTEQLALGWQWPLWRQGGGARPAPPASSLDDTPAARAVQAAAAAGERDGEGRVRVAGSGAGRCGGSLYGVGRLDYSLRERRVSGAIAGLEYDAGCWVGRAVLERRSTGTSTATTHLMLQLELVGLSRLGSNPLTVLKDNIPGYRLLRDSVDGSVPAP
ncbi:MAG: hypothetical protein RL722_29 [Pseudomonadota bacterium]|jgi:LPS-assembly protein